MEDKDQSGNKSQDQETQDDYLQCQDSQELQSVAGKHDHLTDEERAAAVGNQVDDEKNEERKDDAQNVQRTENKYTKLKELILAQKDMKPEVADLATALKDSTKYDIVVDDTKQQLNTIFLGHVDSGKATICGSILDLTGQIEECKIDRLTQESRQNNRALWWRDYLMDIDRYHIVNPAKPKFETANKILTILDSPGFKNYSDVLNNSRVEIACLVISARLGEFEAGFEKGGQTTQHALLAKCLGAQDLIVLINKMDEKQINWSQERYEYIKEKLAPFLRDSCGYDLEKNIHWLPISAENGGNMMTGVKDPRGSWYSGPTFFQLLDDLPVPERDPEGSVRIPVLDKFRDGSNLNVFGKVASGTITHGMSLTAVPSGELLTIDTIYNYADLRIPYAKPGENIRLIMKENDEQSISRGDLICSNYDFVYACTEIECEINILNLPQHKYIIAPGYTCTLFIHTAIEEVTITAIKATLEQTAAKPKPAKFLKSGSVGIVRIARTDNNAICCDKFEKSSYLGGFTLRDEGALIAFGKVLRVKPV